MAVSAVHNIGTNDSILQQAASPKISTDGAKSFDNLLTSAIDMYKQTDDLQKAAEQAEVNFSLGYANSTHELGVAQQKANIALQYTVNVTNKVIDAYKELMNLQI